MSNFFNYNLPNGLPKTHRYSAVPCQTKCSGVSDERVNESMCNQIWDSYTNMSPSDVAKYKALCKNSNSNCIKDMFYADKIVSRMSNDISNPVRACIASRLYGGITPEEFYNSKRNLYPDRVFYDMGITGERFARDGARDICAINSSYSVCINKWPPSPIG